MESAKRCEDKWAEFHEAALPYEQAIAQEPFKTLIKTILSLAKVHKLTAILETGFGTGYVAIKIANELNIGVVGIESSSILIERAEKLATEKRALSIAIEKDDIFNPEMYERSRRKPWLIYHQGLLEHFSDKKIVELLRLQTENAFAVIFSVPSKFYGRQDFGDERLMVIDQWAAILSDFDLLKLEYYDNQRHILGILKGAFYE